MEYQTLIDCEGIELESGKPFRFACCDCGLVHDVVIVAADGNPVGLAVKRNSQATAHRRQHTNQGAAAQQDKFVGDDAALVHSIQALLSLDATGSLVPHGIGGHARVLLNAAASRLRAQQEGQE